MLEDSETEGSEAIRLVKIFLKGSLAECKHRN